MGENTIIRVDNISKKFGSNLVIKDLSLDIEQGTAIVFTGHNGVGKSTLLKIIAKLINIDQGNIIYNKKINVSYIPEHFPRMSFTANDFLIHMGMISGKTLEESEKRAHDLMEQYFMLSMKDTKLKHLSKGTLQKVSVIQALMSEPDVLLLDEPLSGQDVDSQNVFIEEVNRLKSQGLTVIMSCHEKFLINRLADIVYKFENKNIKRTTIQTGNFKEYDILTFDIQKYKGNVTEQYKDYVIQSAYDPQNKNLLKIVIDEQYSNAYLCEMIKNGGVIKEMRHENN